MKAKINKQTEKAVNITYCCEIYGESFTVKNVWMPKSQITIISIENDVIDFIPNNDWILTAKTKEYCQYVINTFGNVKSEIKTFCSPINNCIINYIYI